MSNITAERYHDICMGHRVVGHEGKCKNLHGHNYRFWFVVQGKELDCVGRVLDFSVIKSTLCSWLEQYWDHKFLIWTEDPMLPFLHDLNSDGVVAVEFNPTAENIAIHFLKNIAPLLLPENCELVELKIEETRKCSVTIKL